MVPQSLLGGAAPMRFRMLVEWLTLIAIVGSCVPATVHPSNAGRAAGCKAKGEAARNPYDANTAWSLKSQRAVKSRKASSTFFRVLEGTVQ